MTRPSLQLLPLTGGPLGGCTVRVYGRLGDHLLVADGRYVRLDAGEWVWEADHNFRCEEARRR